MWSQLCTVQERTQGKDDGCSAHQNRSLKNIDFVDKIILNVINDLHLPFSHYQPLKSAYYLKMRILKNETK
jgi:hypothetical protein